MVSPLVPRGQEAERPVAQSPDSGARRHEFSAALTLPSFGASGKSCDLPVLPHLSGATKAPSWGVVRLNQLLFVDRPKQCLIQNSHLTHGLGNMRFLIREFSKELMLALPLKHSNRIFLGYASLTVQAASPPTPTLVSLLCMPQATPLWVAEAQPALAWVSRRQLRSSVPGAPLIHCSQDTG